MEAGSQWAFDYRLYWIAEEPLSPNVGHVVATRIGREGIPGQETARKKGQHKFVIDFEGGHAGALKQRYDVDCAVTASRGNVIYPYVLKVVGSNCWRATFDLDLPGSDLVELRCFLRLGKEKHGCTSTSRRSSRPIRLSYRAESACRQHDNPSPVVPAAAWDQKR